MVAPAFTPAIRRAFWSSVEFSVSDRMNCWSTMIPATSAVLKDLDRWTDTLRFSEMWLMAVRRAALHIAPDAALFRIDWTGESPSALTWYLRFPQPPNDAQFNTAMRHAHPFEWVGPTPTVIAQALGLTGPRGMALRVASSGNRHTAIYYRIRNLVSGNAQPTDARLMEACGLPASQSELIRDDLQLLGSFSEVAVIGMDKGSSALSVEAVKIDVRDVPVVVALRFFAAKHASLEAQARVELLASSLYARHLSYLGLKYTKDGFGEWRAYFSSVPARFGRTHGNPIAANAQLGKNLPLL